MNVSVLGIVSPAGSDRTKFVNSLVTLLRHDFDFDVHLIKLNQLIYDNKPELNAKIYKNKIEKIRDKINAGNEIRMTFDNDIFAYFGAVDVISEINLISDPARRTIFILDQLKRTEEIECLRALFGKCYFSIGIVAPESVRLSNLTEDDQSLRDKAEDLISIDENEGDHFKNSEEHCDLAITDDAKKHGQQIAKCVLACDVLFEHRFDSSNVSRFMDLLLGHPYLPPSQDEYHLNFAFAASLKSLDLSRQVGAVIVSMSGEVIGVGYNEVNKFGGGPYSGILDSDKNDYLIGADPNKMIINKIKSELGEKLFRKLKNQNVGKEAIDKVLNSSMINDLTEFHRATHAEMNAILSAQRSGLDVKNSTLYCTTFPCHNCCKHIISSGITQVIYLEPYKKSYADKLHEHEITYSASLRDERVLFRSFFGVTHNRFDDLFSISYGSGYKVSRKDGNDKKVEFQRMTSPLRYSLNTKTIRKLGKILSESLTNGEKFDSSMYLEFIKQSV
ncbi:MAG: hypothetical protein IPL83_07510 [Bdellovibrionales bacterium]|nr:hypothetical protein [Bdellovibrionales bacterium]